MTRELAKRIENYVRQLPTLQACHQAIQELYPELKVRWTKIYGRRWSHVWGTKPVCSAPAGRCRLTRDGE